MQEYSLLIKEALAKGLRENVRHNTNAPRLVEMLFCVPEEGTARTLPFLPAHLAIPDVPQNGFASKEAFPFPQLLRLRELTLVCGWRHLYELVDGMVVWRFTTPHPANLWSVADFGQYILLSNGQDTVQRNPDSGAFSIATDVPQGICICDFQGQILVGGLRTQPGR